MKTVKFPQSSHASIIGSGRWLLLSCLALCAVVAGTVGAGNAGAEEGQPTEIATAPDLNWGFKLSWRVYAGTPAVSEGAGIVSDAGNAGFNVGWEFDSGSYDAETGTTVLSYSGSARWTSHGAGDGTVSPPPGYDGPMDIALLDVTVTDPVITISADTATVTAEVKSRNLATWQIVDYGRIPIVNLAADQVTPTVAAGTTSWASVPAVIDAAAGAPFGDSYYRPGIIVDPVSFSYSGPGGAPDFSENFDAEGMIKLEADGENQLVAPAGTIIGDYETFAVDTARQLVHYRVHDSAGDWTFQAFDLTTMQKLGDPLTVSWLDFLFPAMNDTSSGKLYAFGFFDGYPRRWIRFDRDLGTYVQGENAEPIPTANDNTPLAWDPVGERAFEVVRTVPNGVDPSDFDHHVWQLRTFTEQPGGTWAVKGYDLPSGPPNLNLSVYQRLGVTAADGSLILLGDAQSPYPDTSAAAPETIPGAYRVVTHEDGTAEVTPVPGSDVANDHFALYGAEAGPDGTVALVNANGSTTVQQMDVTPANGEIRAGAVVDTGFPGNEVRGIAVDPEDGTVWIGGAKTQRIVGVRDGRVVADQFFANRNTRAGTLIAGPNGTLIMQSNEGAPDNFQGSAFGFQKLKRAGVTATIDTDPEDRSVALGSGEESEDVSFSAAASATPTPSLQWQVKAPGATRFSDLAGATGATLEVSAKRGMDGAQYRAVLANAAGRVATEAATLSVDYAPRIGFDLLDLSVKEGADAEFEFLHDGNPEPAVTWQRRVGGFWQAIDPGDDNFVLDGPSLTVLDTNLEQSGALFRAKLSNAVATTYSRVAKLTVTPATTIPAGGVDLDHVSLDWSGNAEMQKAPPFGGSNYFSAGASDGKEATYSAAAGNVRIYQVAPGGGEVPATYATRASHVTSASEQLVRLYGGKGRVEEDGGAAVEWDGAFGVNFYGGLAPFTLTDPELTVDAEGKGSLHADLSGCASSQANPSQCTPFAPVPDVTVATFSGVEVDPAGAVSIAPDYAGVEVSVPVPLVAQDRVVAGWGSWPQPFVDFHVKTGLSSYWYSSGGSADAEKEPSPFLVDFDGESLPAAPESPPPSPGQGSGAAPKAEPQGSAKGSDSAGALAQIAVAGGVQTIDRRRLATLATLTCPGNDPCVVGAPKRVKLEVAGQSFWARVLAPQMVDAGGSAAVKVKLPQAALRELGRRTARGRIGVTVRSQEGAVKKVLAVRLKRGGNGTGRPAAP